MTGVQTCALPISRQFAFGSILMAAEAKPVSKEKLKKLLLQGLKFTVIHEVGHTLGLRHNFKASTFLTDRKSVV